MKSYKLTLCAMIAAIGLAGLTTGCEHTIAKTETQKVKSNGQVERREKTITEEPDGTITKEEKKSVN